MGGEIRHRKQVGSIPLSLSLALPPSLSPALPPALEGDVIPPPGPDRGCCRVRGGRAVLAAMSPRCMLLFVFGCVGGAVVVNAAVVVSLSVLLLVHYSVSTGLPAITQSLPRISRYSASPPIPPSYLPLPPSLCLSSLSLVSPLVSLSRRGLSFPFRGVRVSVRSGVCCPGKWVLSLGRG